MITQIIQNIKDEVLRAGHNLNMEKQRYKEFLLEKTQNKLLEMDLDSIIKDFDKLSEHIYLNDLEPTEISLEPDMTVKKFIKSFKYTLLAGFIVNDIVKTTYIESIYNSIN